MKLYEFTFNTTQNLSLKAIRKLLKEHLIEEAHLIGWKLGYRLKMVDSKTITSNNEIEYFFEVHGQYLSDHELT